MAKRKTFRDYDWSLIQHEYDKGLSTLEIIHRFDMRHRHIRQAKDNGLFKPRNISDSVKMYNKVHGSRKLTQETKNKISKTQKAYYLANPDKIPYLKYHYSKGLSYPEQYFKELFEKERIPLQMHKQVSLYQLDFYNEERMIDVEIDGDQHHRDPKIIESDKRRNAYLESLGWKVFRIKWSEYQKLDYDSKHAIVEQIRALVS